MKTPPSTTARFFKDFEFVRHFEIIAGQLSKAGRELGCISAIDLSGRTIWIVDAHGYGKRFIVHAEEILTAFLNLELAVAAT
jgi:hypothetical protein